MCIIAQIRKIINSTYFKGGYFIMGIKINKLEIENVKRVKAVKIEPSASGLTVIGGDNNQGKTSVLDSIAWALGGEKYRPSSAQREGSIIPPNLHIVMSNGLVVERKGKNSDLKVIDPNGKKGGQQLLNEFVEQLALDLPKFMKSSSKDKANALLQIIGVGSQLAELELKETELYNQRRAIGQIADQKKKYAKEQEYYPDAPKEPVSASELIRQQQEILTRNGENQKKRQNLQYFENKAEEIQKKLDALLAEQSQVLTDLETARKSALDLHDESTAELEENIANIETINRKVRANLDKDKAEEDAQEYMDQYNKLTADIEDVRKQKVQLLDNADLPLEGLSVTDGELTYNEFKWDNLSGSDQLKVSTAIVRKLNPNCGFVLLDKLEQMDLKTLKEFGTWLENEGLQAIATRVSTGNECSIIIEDGYVVGQDFLKEDSNKTEQKEQKWKAGEF
jgi:DNA repair exonuclease SbcCD ATPase subunit